MSSEPVLTKAPGGVEYFNHAIGTFGIIPARSRYDLYKQTLKITFDDASIRLTDNDLYLGPMAYTGAELHDNIGSFFHGIHDLSFLSFMKLWKSATVENILRGFQQSVKSRRAASAPSSTFRMRKKAKSTERISDVNFSETEYAIERKILEAPSLELSYYADVLGLVPVDQEMLEYDGWDIGNGDFEPEWGIDIVVHGGFIKYGPWADRQRAELQQVFFPPSYRDTQPTTYLKPGDRRMWTALHMFVELRNGTTLYMPFREVSKDWLWDGQTDVPRPKKREPASFSIKAGDDSTIRYIMPIVAGVQGFEPLLDIHLGSAAISSSLNDIRLLTNESCRIDCKPSSPLKWKGNRTWMFAVTLHQPVFYLLRDHINMLADLGKDWTSGPASNYLTWAPTEYVINLDMQSYEINTYVNDHNIIDKPLIRDENGRFMFRFPD
ncbi:hypothetical protein EWM64_g4317 [Hericium alpestre]|uniref:Csf1 N-terminal domain-containing protein n=1 Tax=Hericium alpestre TaxID=135208 RepID=A0A4Y9ZXU1_9AGAM|nr:hypothetical protein EWM64_g4317 [Hericium alpestre]